MPTSPSRPVLAIDASSSRCSAVLWAAEADCPVLAAVEREGPTGEAALLPRLVADLLAGAGRHVADLAAIAVAVGPGSFTGLRASLAFAEGLAAGADIPVIGVTVAEALAEAASAEAEGLPVWCALDARNGRLFLHRGGAPTAWEVVSLAAPPLPDGRIALTGDAAQTFGAALRGAGADVVTTGARQTHAREVAMAAARRAAGLLPPLPTTPLYVDPPRALAPQGGLRPPPFPVGAGS